MLYDIHLCVVSKKAKLLKAECKMVTSKGGGKIGVIFFLWCKLITKRQTKDCFLLMGICPFPLLLLHMNDFLTRWAGFQIFLFSRELFSAGQDEKSTTDNAVLFFFYLSAVFGIMAYLLQGQVASC